MSNVLSANQETEISHLNISNYFDTNFDHYFLYTGSLTTPTCNEGVHWIVPTSLSYVNEKQLDLFRKAQGLSADDENLLSDNFRPIQPLNDRKLYKVTQNFEGKSGI